MFLIHPNIAWNTDETRNDGQPPAATAEPEQSAGLLYSGGAARACGGAPSRQDVHAQPCVRARSWQYDSAVPVRDRRLARLSRLRFLPLDRRFLGLSGRAQTDRPVPAAGAPVRAE